MATPRADVAMTALPGSDATRAGAEPAAAGTMNTAPTAGAAPGNVPAAGAAAGAAAPQEPGEANAEQPVMETFTTTLSCHMCVRKESLQFALVGAPPSAASAASASAAASAGTAEESGAAKTAAGARADAEAPAQPAAYVLSFDFDSTVDVLVNVYYMARPRPIAANGEPTVVNGHVFETVNGLLLPSREYAPGRKLAFALEPQDAFVPSTYAAAELIKDSNLSAYPVVISLETAPRALAAGAEAQRYLLYCTLFLQSASTYGLKPLKSVVRIAGCSYLLHEIFGVAADKDDESNECVVCMTDPKDTVVLPCRHMCLCASCAKELRQRSNRCPMCRIPFQSLLQFRAGGKAKVASGDESDAAVDLAHPSAAGALAGPASGPAAAHAAVAGDAVV